LKKGVGQKKQRHRAAEGIYRGPEGPFEKESPETGGGGRGIGDERGFWNWKEQGKKNVRHGCNVTFRKGGEEARVPSKRKNRKKVKERKRGKAAGTRGGPTAKQYGK